MKEVCVGDMVAAVREMLLDPERDLARLTEALQEAVWVGDGEIEDEREADTTCVAVEAEALLVSVVEQERDALGAEAEGVRVALHVGVQVGLAVRGLLWVAERDGDREREADTGDAVWLWESVIEGEGDWVQDEEREGRGVGVVLWV